MMCAPSHASRSAWDRPCPRAAPETRATLPSRRPAMVISFRPVHSADSRLPTMKRLRRLAGGWHERLSEFTELPQLTARGYRGAGVFSSAGRHFFLEGCVNRFGVSMLTTPAVGRHPVLLR